MQHTCTEPAFLVILVICLLQIGTESAGINTVTSCLNNCSGHGKCESINKTDTCICDDQWGGVSCAYHNFDLPSDHALSVTISKDEYYYFTITNDDPPKKNLTVIILGFTKDPKVLGPSFYLSYGYYPNSTHYDFMNNSVILKKSLTVLNSKPGKWYLAVRGQDPTPLILTVQANLNDIHNGSKQLSHSRHVCAVGDRSDNCEEYAREMEIGVLYRGSLTRKQVWNYWYHITGRTTPPGVDLVATVTVGEEQDLPELQFFNDGWLQLAAAGESSPLMCKDSYPAKLLNHDEARETLPAVKSRSCVFSQELINRHNGKLYLGVFGGRINILGPYTIFVKQVEVDSV